MDEWPTIVSITYDALDLNGLLQKVTLPTTGAAAIFTGIVRGETTREGRKTEHLEYESYIPMAEAKMQQIASEIREKWPLIEGIVLVQRIGELFPLTPTVVIICTAAHRDTGVFDAAKYGIDRLKEIVPVWKKEFGPAGEEWIEGHYKPNPGE
jgi:molybdopterin synthase catalytic subunit